jgi:hypothetical protein
VHVAIVYVVVCNSFKKLTKETTVPVQLAQPRRKVRRRRLL